MSRSDDLKKVKPNYLEGDIRHIKENGKIALKEAKRLEKEQKENGYKWVIIRNENGRITKKLAKPCEIQKKSHSKKKESEQNLKIK